MKCQWTEEGDGFEGYGNWRTSCGSMFSLTTGTPEENEMKYCCYCGKELDEVPYKPEDE